MGAARLQWDMRLSRTLCIDMVVRLSVLNSLREGERQVLKRHDPSIQVVLESVLLRTPPGAGVSRSTVLVVRELGMQDRRLRLLRPG